MKLGKARQASTDDYEGHFRGLAPLRTQFPFWERCCIDEPVAIFCVSTFGRFLVFILLCRLPGE